MHNRKVGNLYIINMQTPHMLHTTCQLESWSCQPLIYNIKCVFNSFVTFRSTYPSHSQLSNCPELVICLESAYISFISFDLYHYMTVSTCNFASDNVSKNDTVSQLAITQPDLYSVAIFQCKMGCSCFDASITVANISQHQAEKRQLSISIDIQSQTTLHDSSSPQFNFFFRQTGFISQCLSFLLADLDKLLNAISFLTHAVLSSKVFTCKMWYACV